MMIIKVLFIFMLFLLLCFCISIILKVRKLSKTISRTKVKCSSNCGWKGNIKDVEVLWGSYWCPKCDGQVKFDHYRSKNR